MTQSLQWTFERDFHFIFHCFTLNSCMLLLCKHALSLKRNGWPWDKTAQGSCWLFSTKAIFPTGYWVFFRRKVFGICLFSSDNLIFYFCWKERTPDSWKALCWKQNITRRFGNALQLPTSQSGPALTLTQHYNHMAPSAGQSCSVWRHWAARPGNGAKNNFYKPLKAYFQASVSNCSWGLWWMLSDGIICPAFAEKNHVLCDLSISMSL